MPFDYVRWIKLMLLFGPALALAVLGMMLVLKSGEAGPDGTIRVRAIASSASRMLVRLSFWAAGLAVVGEMVGLRTFFAAN